MAHTDPYRLSTTPTPVAESPGDDGRVDLVRALLWTVVVVSAVANTAASYAEVSLWLQLPVGFVTLLAATTLVMRKLRRR